MCYRHVRCIWDRCCQPSDTVERGSGPSIVWIIPTPHWYGLHFVSDINFACHRFEDEGLTVFLEEFNFSVFYVEQFVNLFGFLVKVVGDLSLFRKW